MTVAGERPDITARAREEFLAESRELVDVLGRELLALGEALRRGREDPDTLASVFRAVHTLKGMAGIFGAPRLASLAHALEDLLDGLRLERTTLDRPVLDRLFTAVECLGVLLERGDEAGDDGAIERLVASLRPEAAPRAVAVGENPPVVPRRYEPPVADALVPAPAVDDKLALRAGRTEHSVRVDIRRLDHLLDVMGELSRVRSALRDLAEHARDGALDPRALRGELHRLHRDLDRGLDGMQRGILEVRMVPLGQVFERLAREVRKVSGELSKDIRLVVTGVDTVVDKVVAEALAPLLLHLVRNAIDHGIEAPGDRARRGKAPEGTLAINAYHAGSHVVIEVEDDGGGVDPGAVADAAVRRGFVTEAAARAMGARERMDLLFLPGLSTRERVTETSGRGVGMDVVRTHIARLGGAVELASELAVYTRVTVTLPITLAMLPALVVGVAGRRYALPMAHVTEAARLAPEAVRRVDGREVTSFHGRTLALCRLAVLFGHEGVDDPPTAPARFMVVVVLGGQETGLVVDELVGRQDVVIKPLGHSLRRVRGFAGATDLGDQRLGLVLDPVALLDEAPGEAPTLEVPVVPGAGAVDGGRRYLGFRVGAETYGLPLTDLREILRMLPVTEVPRAGDDILGVISAHGVVTTLIDLRRRLGRATDPTPDARARILLVAAAEEVFGLRVDEVTRIYRVTDAQFERVSQVPGTCGPHGIVGVARPTGAAGRPEAPLMVLELAGLLPP